MRKALSSLGFLALGYWCMFWTLNGLDKFLNRTDIGLLTWYGNDRDEKFTMYFDRLGMSESVVNPVLMFAGVWELAAAAICAIAMVAFYKGAPMAEKMEKANQAIIASAITFIGFCIFDVIVGDRAELLEHSTYIGVVIISYILLALEPVFAELHKDLGVESEAEQVRYAGRYPNNPAPLDPGAVAAE